MSIEMSTNGHLNKLMNQIQSNFDNLDQLAKLNKSVELANTKLTKMKQYEMSSMSFDKIYEDVQVMVKDLKSLAMKTTSMNEELDEKEANARLINQSIVDLPQSFDELIERFQDNELLIELNGELERLNEEMRGFQSNLAIYDNKINECLSDQQKQQTRKVESNTKSRCLDAELDELIKQLENSKQINCKRNDETGQLEDEHGRIQGNFTNLNNSLTLMQQKNEAMKVELNEKTVQFNELKVKKQSLLDGTYVDDETKKLKVEIDKKQDDLNRMYEQIDEIKSKSQTRCTQSQALKIPKLQDENVFKQVKALVTKLGELISLNYKDQYLVFDDSASQSK